ncbi:TetR/AcrR family transcriptional regulator [Aromatoleum petrolei]|uniref:TetR family transcriptional regulator n=1 Tax=Aromatoleum petrolei TaxID=76116 RepID=A0ABX1N0C8_9RHOO|nr:TetR/AcrR family transcriptional regulator [Aromatoleum petrolei]NMF90912.1 TetR family transcriptional regulator [Aromatoleum petrolei]QTQ35108.1 Transcriptional regulator, TetR family [Aromatoleum petrolei]
MTSAPAAAHDDPQPSPTEAEILRLSREEPGLGQAAVAERLRRTGLTISPSGVRYIWQKHGLETTAKRLQALVDATPEGLATLTDNQRELLERGTLSTQLAICASDGSGDHDEPRDRRQIILDAAAELFSEQGYDRSSIRDIARKVGLLPGSVYHHFASKDELYLAVHHEGFQRVMHTITKEIEALSDPWARLRRACEVHVTQMIEGPAVERITGHNLALVGNQELLAKIQPAREAYEQLFRDLVNALPLAAGTDRSLLRLFLLGGMNWVYLWYREGRRTPQQIAEAMVEMVRRGVAPP